MRNNSTVGRSPEYEYTHDSKRDCLEIRFRKPREIIYEYPDGSDKSVFMKRDDKGRIVVLRIVEFSKRSSQVKEFLKLFNVDAAAVEIEVPKPQYQ